MNLIYIVINNLLSNAVKYSNEGAKIYVSCGEKDGKSYIRIQDEGCGIEKENISKIFESFYREKKDRNAEGFGLGLSQAMKIAELYGGGFKLKVQRIKEVFSHFYSKTLKINRRMSIFNGALILIFNNPILGFFFYVERTIYRVGLAWRII